MTLSLPSNLTTLDKANILDAFFEASAHAALDSVKGEIKDGYVSLSLSPRDIRVHGVAQAGYSPIHMTRLVPYDIVANAQVAVLKMHIDEVVRGLKGRVR